MTGQHHTELLAIDPKAATLLMSDQDIHQQIDELVAEEHQLRNGEALTPEQRGRLQELETRLDRAWDLLRRRDGLRDKGENPDDAKAASVDQVEGYLQ